ncbi:hypothetical protein C7B65_02295 [Phormidesmis priestleyi ULC007]|uniref:Uncharacterized protein n=1 Tax=Phormidesmis priestleyi ULC007 TaxID=1920490 RepID=A0A2T1DLR8_9CYAN|nr:hypothetical protein C7B65_02295 [Phormidesmis priestleyi ULC007]
MGAELEGNFADLGDRSIPKSVQGVSSVVANCGFDRVKPLSHSPLRIDDNASFQFTNVCGFRYNTLENQSTSALQRSLLHWTPCEELGLE